jgi:hypothetical protein
VVAAVFACAAVLGSAFVSLATGAAAGVIAVPLIVAVLLTATAVTLRKKPGRRAFAAGILTGVAIALLLDGVCWSIILNTRIGG